MCSGPWAPWRKLKLKQAKSAVGCPDARAHTRTHTRAPTFAPFLATHTHLHCPSSPHPTRSADFLAKPVVAEPKAAYGEY